MACALAVRRLARRGEIQFPGPVERVFLEHPDVCEALATGVPDELRGEAVHLLVVAGPNKQLTENDLMAWASLRLDRYKLPDRIHFADQVPVGRTGKSDRDTLSYLITHGEL